MFLTNNRKERISLLSVVAVLLSAIMMLAISVFSLSAAEPENNFAYTVEEGEAKITGFTGSGKVIIPSEIDGYLVTVIGEHAFATNDAITSVVIPDSVKTIEASAFTKCESLKSVTIGNGVTVIGVYAFGGCVSITDVRIGTGVKVIDTAAFGTCESLSQIVIPDNVETIESTAFYGCSSLEKVEVGKGVISIGAGSFAECPLLNEISLSHENKSFAINDGILYNKEITALIFCPASKGEINFPETVTSIGDMSIVHCDKIERLNIPEGVTHIGECAVFECLSLKEVVLPDSMISAGAAALSANYDLSSVTFGNGLMKISDSMFKGCISLTNLTIPDNVTGIGDKAFFDCSSLKTVTIPGGVNEMGEQVFEGCRKLTDIYFGGTRSEWSLIARDAEVPTRAVVHYGGNADPDPLVVFNDVDSDAYYAEAVTWAVENGITSGTSKTTFSPDDECTRGQIVTFLWRAAGSPEPESENNPFTDVNGDDYYFKAVLWAVEKGITKGTSATKFSPHNVCTRGQVVTFLWRVAGSPGPESENNPFIDIKTGDYYYNAVLWAVEKNITKGTSEKTFSPTNTCIRGQVVTFLYRNALL